MHLVLLVGLPELPEDVEKTGSQIVAATHTARSAVLLAVVSIAGLQKRTPRVALHLLRDDGLGSALCCIVAATHTTHLPVLLADAPVAAVGPLEWHIAQLASHLLQREGLVATARRTIPTATARPVAPSLAHRNVVI